MAINVNTVYTTVLSILNKEQRGYLTPDEFNKVATQAQLNIFENIFEDLNQQLRTTQNNFDYSNRKVNLDDVISTFKCFGVLQGGSGGEFTLPIVDSNTGTTIVYNDSPAFNEFAFYRLGTITYEGSTKPIQIERLQRNPFYNIDRSDLTAPSENYPVYLYENLEVFVKPITITADVRTTFIRKPKDVVWGYGVGTLGQYTWDGTPSFSLTPVIPSTGSVNFEISSNQQTEVILEILKLSGVIIRDPQIVQAASQELAQDEVNSKR